MSLAQSIIYNVPSLFLGAIIIVSALIMAVSGLYIVRKNFSHQKLKTHNDIAGAIFNTLGVAYAVLMTFVVMSVWENFEKSRQNVAGEANCLADLYRNSDGFSADFRARIKDLSTGYANAIINDEWEMLAKGDSSPAAQKAFDSLSEAYTTYSPSTEREKIFFAESVRKLTELSDLRRMRIVDAGSGIHPTLWLVLLVGGVTTIVFTFFFGSENPRAQMLMTVLLAVMIALILYTILMFDFPFTGGIRISPRAFDNIISG